MFLGVQILLTVITPHIGPTVIFLTVTHVPDDDEAAAVGGTMATANSFSTSPLGVN